MKQSINKKKISKSSNIKNIDTSSSLINYITQYGIGYVVRNYVLSDDLIKDISDGKYSEKNDDLFTLKEIMFFQSTLTKI